MRTLVIPPAAQRDEDAVQMLSAWIAENGLHCSMNVGMWKARGLSETTSWGILLADVARHIAKAIEEQQGLHAGASVDQIVDAMLKELEDPTSKLEGGFGSA